MAGITLRPTNEDLKTRKRQPQSQIFATYHILSFWQSEPPSLLLKHASLQASPLIGTPFLAFHHMTGSTIVLVANSTHNATPRPQTALVWKHSALPLPAHPVSPITALSSFPDARAMAKAHADSAELAADALRIERQFRWLMGRPRRTEMMVKARRRRKSRAVRIRRVVEAEL